MPHLISQFSRYAFTGRSYSSSAGTVVIQNALKASKIALTRGQFSLENFALLKAQKEVLKDISSNKEGSSNVTAVQFLGSTTFYYHLLYDQLQMPVRDPGCFQVCELSGIPLLALMICLGDHPALGGSTSDFDKASSLRGQSVSSELDSLMSFAFYVHTEGGFELLPQAQRLDHYHISDFNLAARPFVNGVEEAVKQLGGQSHFKHKGPLYRARKLDSAGESVVWKSIKCGDKESLGSLVSTSPTMKYSSREVRSSI